METTAPEVGAIEVAAAAALARDTERALLLREAHTSARAVAEIDAWLERAFL